MDFSPLYALFLFRVVQSFARVYVFINWEMRKLCKATVRPTQFLNLNSICKKILLSSPPPPLAIAPWLRPLQPETPSQSPSAPHLNHISFAPVELYTCVGKRGEWGAEKN